MKSVPKHHFDVERYEEITSKYLDVVIALQKLLQKRNDIVVLPHFDDLQIHGWPYGYFFHVYRKGVNILVETVFHYEDNDLDVFGKNLLENDPAQAAEDLYYLMSHEFKRLNQSARTLMRAQTMMDDARYGDLDPSID